MGFATTGQITQELPDATTAGPLRVLAADDDPIMRELMASGLSDDRYQACVVGNGEEAAEKLDATSFDLCIFDLEMPGRSGFDLIKMMRARPVFADIPVIVVTSREDEVAIEKAFGAGATSFVTKPVNWPLFHHQIRFVVRAARQHQQLRAAQAASERQNLARANLFRLLAHELRTPINAITGFSQLLTAGGDTPPDRDYLAELNDAGLRLNDVISDVMHYSRLLDATSPYELDELDAGEIIAEAARGLLAQAEERGHTVTVTPPSPPVLVRANQQALLIALRKVIGNAIVHCPAGTAITIGAVVGEDEALTYEVVDDGPGFDASRLASEDILASRERIASRSQGGLGLGLAIARRVALHLGGRLEVASTPGAGTRAAICFPADRCRVYGLKEAS